jgi:translation initiation factor 1
VRLEKRKGRTVTVVTGLGLEPDALRKLAREWKGRLGSGGTVKDDGIELQGDVRDEVKGFLAESSGQ